MTPAEKLAAEKRKRPGKVARTMRRTPTFATAIKAARASVGLTQPEVAEAVGLAKNSFEMIERGYAPQLSTAFRIASFFGKTVDELWKPMAAEKSK